MKTLVKLGIPLGLFLGLLMSIVPIGLPKVSAYTATVADTNLTWEVINRLFIYFKDKNRPDDEMQKVEQKLDTLATQYKETAPQYTHIFSMAHHYLSSLRQKVNEVGYTDNAEAFIAKYSQTLQTAWDSPSDLGKCFEQYPLIDHLARQMGMPPSYLMATWYIESTCRMNNPNNGDGLFQIINNHYEPGTVNIAELADQIGDFEDFIKRKMNRYNSKQTTPITYGYNTYNIDTLQTFAALYNGLAGQFTAYPLGLGNPYYFWGNYSTDYTSRKDGWLVFFLKILKIENEMLKR